MSFASLGLCWETWSWAEQEASILSLNAVLRWGPGCSLEGGHLGDQAGREGDLGESKTSATGRDQSRGLRLWWTQRCAAQMLLFGRTCCPTVSSFWGENHLPSRRDSPQWGRSRRPGSWETGAAVVTSCGETTTWVTSSAPWGLADMWGSWVAGQPPLCPPCPLLPHSCGPSKHPARPQKLTVNWATWKDGWVCRQADEDGSRDGLSQGQEVSGVGGCH